MTSSISLKTRAALVIGVVAALAVFAWQVHPSQRRASVTTDEVKHLVAGLMAVRWGTEPLDLDVPPLAKVVAAVPALSLAPRLLPPERLRQPHTAAGLGEFIRINPKTLDHMVARGRMTTLGWGLLLGFGIAFISYRIYGPKGVPVSMALYAFSPTLLAHAGFLTTDMAATACGVWALGLHMSARDARRWTRLVPAGIALGLALATKYTAATVLAAILLVEFAAILRRTRLPLRVHAVRLGGLLVAAYLTICIVYLANGRTLDYLAAFGEPAMSPYAAHPYMHSDEFALGFFLPVPLYYLMGFEAFLHNALHGFPTYFLGEVKSHGGWLAYFWVAFLLKTSTAALLAMGLALLTVLARRCGNAMRRGEGALLVTAAIVMLAATAASANIGVRHILLVYPLLFILCGRLACFHIPRRKVLVAATVGLAALVLEAALAHPNYLAHFNVFAGGPAYGARFFSNSNLTYHHHLLELRDRAEKLNADTIYLAYGVDMALLEHYGIIGGDAPAFRPFPAFRDGAPRPGWYAAGIIERQGLWTGEPNPIVWLRDYTPEFIIGRDIAFYKIK